MATLIVTTYFLVKSISAIVNAHSCIILIFCFAGLFPLFVFLLQHLMDWLMDIASVDFAI